MAEFKKSIEFQAEDRDVTRGDAFTLRATLKENDEAVTIEAGTPTWSTIIHDKNGQLITIANGDHAVIESSGSDLGRLNIAISAANSARLPVGKKIPVAVQRTVGATVKWYWGYLDQVRAAT